VADWYHDYLEQGDTLQDTIVFPGAQALLSPKAGEQYLDIACGDGAFAEHVAKGGARIVGLDIAPSLIAKAKARRMPQAQFLVADAMKLGQAPLRGPFAGATCILALQNMKDATAVFRGVAPLLPRGAPLVLVLNHPCFRIPRQTHWEWVEAQKTLSRRTDRYLSPLDIPILMHPGKQDGVATTSYHRPLSFYVSALAQTGFSLDAMEEWVSDRQSQPGARAKAENRARAEFPLFLALRARKQ
jgi:SAM-dependent methyltransferase